jgi:hypothetical protein
MSRDLTAASQTAAEGAHVRIISLVYLGLSTAVYVNSSDRDIVFAGNTYLGVGRLGSISAIVEHSAIQASGITLTMTGIPQAYTQMVLSSYYQGKTVSIWQGFLNDSYALIADPILQWTGMIDQMSLSLGETATITITAESKLIRWENPIGGRYTDADQQARFPGDLGLQFVSQTVEREIIWGRVRARQ